MHGHGDNIELVAKDLVPLQGAGLQKCLAFSFDGSKFASGGVVRSNIHLMSSCYLWFRMHILLLLNGLVHFDSVP